MSCSNVAYWKCVQGSSREDATVAAAVTSSLLGLTQCLLHLNHKFLGWRVENQLLCDWRSKEAPLKHAAFRTWRIHRAAAALHAQVGC
jgi:hypothetical protein